MPITVGCLNLQFLIQTYLIPPYLIDPNPLRMSTTPSYSKPFCLHRIIWITIKFNILIIFTSSLSTVIYSLSTWKSHQNLEALGIYSILAAIGCIAWFTYNMLDVHLIDICFLLTQRFKLLEVPSSVGRPTRNRKHDTGELLIYGFGAGFCAFPLIVSSIPLIRDYDPFLKIFFRFFAVSAESGYYLRYFFKALVSGFYGATATHAAGVVLSTVLLVVMAIEAPHKLSFNLYERHRHAMKYTTKLKFNRCLGLFRILQIMIAISNVIATDFLGVLVFMGVLATAGSAFVLLTMYNDLPFLFYLACSLIVPVGITVDFVLVLLASVTNSNGQRFKLFWKQFGKLKRDQKQLKSCAPIGYSIGPVIQVTKESTAFRIADAIVNGAVTLALTQLQIHKSK
ncbi:unnamed protein product [Orchesella dallaii]|uniref:Gustatory receptor n=1 Tax=Orchesella dallaii TaxID=48710 RepID=A0ABP1S119_9HEXA